MKRHGQRPPVGSFEEARRSMLRNFRRLSAEQKLRWLSDMIAFVDAANPDVRWRRLGLANPRKRAKRKRA